MKTIHWHSKTIKFCLTTLGTTLHGLSTLEATQRREQYGSNEIPYQKKMTVLKRWFNQFHHILIYILLIAAIVTGLLQHWIDASVIMGVLLINALIGYIQEGKAEKAIDALRKMLSLRAKVIRDSKRMKIEANELIPGDIVLLQAGDKIPADLRLIKTNDLQVNEAILTGESLPVDKNPSPINKNEPLANRHSLVYSGTFITYGNGVGVVVATGKNTEIGRIASSLKGETQFSTPLLRQLTSFSRKLAIIISSLSLLTFLFGIVIRDYPLEETFMAAVAIAVAIIPEGLPAIITIVFAIGVTRMAKRHAIIRRLASVETLSAVTVICTDKTGTLTKNELTVQQIVTRENQYDVTGSGYNDAGKLLINGTLVDIKENLNLLLLTRAGLLCNEAELNKTEGGWHLIGNPMDGALLALGWKAHLNYHHEMVQYPRTDLIPFDSQHKFMATLHHDHQGNSYILVKGAPEKILSMCIGQWQENESALLDKAYWTSQINRLAQRGMRVLAIAWRKTPENRSNLLFKDVEKDLTLLGIVGIIDPPREEARDAVRHCQNAGLCVKMITGDHKLTAQAIAQQVGIVEEQVLSGDNIDVISDAQLSHIINEIDIYARTIPEHKIRLIKALRAQQHIIAMTGDGVNDAPALKSADIGIAMGIKGSDVAKESSEIVLADDNFSSIEQAIEEARNVYNNLKKILLFILPTNVGEGFSVLFAILFGYTLPITPVQILWVNMITAVTLALALAFEPPEKNLMQQKPRNPNEPLLSQFLLWRIGLVSLLYVLSMFGLFIHEMHHSTDINMARTMVVNVLVFLEAAYLINCRRILKPTLNKEGLLGSIPVLVAIGFVSVFQLGFTYLPPMQHLFKTQSLHWQHWTLILAVVSLIFFLVEFEKKIARHFLKGKSY